MQAGVEITRRQDPGKAFEMERWIAAMIKTANILPLGVTEAREAARLLHGHPGELIEDALIAATANVHGLTVATRNLRHFKLLGVAITNPFDIKST